MVVVRGPGNLPGHLISEVLHGQIVSTLSDERLAKRVQLETITAWTDPEVFLNDMKETARKEEGKLRLLVDELWFANPSSKFLGLVRQVLELIEATKKSVQTDCINVTGVLSAADSDSTTLTEPVSPKTPSTKPGSIPLSYGEPSEEEGNKRLKILEALNDAKETVDSLTGVHEIAKAILTAEIQGELKKLSSAVEELQNALSGAGEIMIIQRFCFVLFSLSFFLFVTLSFGLLRFCLLLNSFGFTRISTMEGLCVFCSLGNLKNTSSFFKL